MTVWMCVTVEQTSIFELIFDQILFFSNLGKEGGRSAAMTGPLGSQPIRFNLRLIFLLVPTLSKFWGQHFCPIAI